MVGGHTCPIEYCKKEKLGCWLATSERNMNVGCHGPALKELCST